MFLCSKDQHIFAFIRDRLCVPLVIDLQSAKTNMNVEPVFFTIARDIKQRLSETAVKPEVSDLTGLLFCIDIYCRKYYEKRDIMETLVAFTLLILNSHRQILF